MKLPIRKCLWNNLEYVDLYSASIFIRVAKLSDSHLKTQILLATSSLEIRPLFLERLGVCVHLYKYKAS